MSGPKWIRQFVNPPASLRQMMFWIWNGEITEKRITEMLEQYAAAGIGGVLIHPRSGLITQYLGKDWWKKWEYSLKECKRLGLECHIYDENGFPSGSAGGLVMEKAPGVSSAILSASLFVNEPVRITGEIIAAFECDQSNKPLRKITAGTDPEQVRQSGRPVIVFTMQRPEHRKWAGPDLTSRKAVTTFIKVTHEAYYRHFESSFGKEIKYAFTDEPGIECGHGFVASAHVLTAFEKDHKYDLVRKVELLCDPGDEGKAVRFDYFRTVNKLWIANFAKNIYDWCGAHGIAFTGHYNEHEWPNPYSIPDSMAAQRWMQVPGIDLLGFQFNPHNRLSNSLYLLTMKEVSSVAAQLGRKRVICEAYGGGGYEMALSQFKPLSDWLFACGINIINPHLSYQSIAGARKYDWPQTISDHASWWDCYKIQADHDARMAVALTRGREHNRVLVLHPTLSAWMYARPRSFRMPGDESVNFCEHLRKSQSTFIQVLADNQIDFDLGDELVIKELGIVKGNTLSMGKCAYKLVVLPPMMETWLASTFRLIEQFLSKGGIVLTSSSAPAYVDGRPDPRPAALAGRFPGQWLAMESEERMLVALRELVPPYVRRPDNLPLPAGITYYRRETDGGEAVHCFVNPWDYEIVTDIHLEGKNLIRLDTVTGSATPVPTKPRGDGQCFSLTLPPSGHALFAGGPRKRIVVKKAPVKLKQVQTGPFSIERLQSNVLVLDYCDLRLRDAYHESINTTKANKLIWQAHGFQGDPWHGMQIRRKIIERTFDAGTGGTVSYRFTIDKDAFGSIFTSINAGIERPWLYRIECNGKTIDTGNAQQWFDEDIGKLALSEYVVPGENVLSLQVSPFHSLCEIAPVCILGEFALQPAERGFTIIARKPVTMGDWRNMGLFFYPWAVRYSTHLTLASAAGGISLSIPKWSGSAIKISIDRKKSGVIAYPPFVLALEGKLDKGDHRIDIDIFGNMKNLMGPPFSDGLPGIWSWDNHPEHAPEGLKYRFFRTGLFEKPVISALPMRR